MNWVHRWIFLSIFSGLFLITTNVNAASLYIDPAFGEISRGDAITLSVRLDTDEAAEECVNAVDGVISYSENIVPVDVSTGDSIFSMWVEQPTIDKDKRTITFAGGIPNGYCGRVPGDPRLTNTIAKLVFRSPGFTIGTQSGSSTAKVEFLPETTAYLNDGFGTKADLALYGTSITLGDKPGAELKDPWRDAVVSDEIPPEQFAIELVQEDKTFGGKHFIVFNTTDKQTGIDQYQVMEEPLADRFTFNWGRADAPWIVARSPYVLEDQSLNSIIRVRALDKAGNEYIATLVPEENLRRLSSDSYLFFGVIGFVALVGLLLLGVMIRSLYRFIKARRGSLETSEEPSHDE
jgi:hypothetical protein